ncbi:hypothetical protein MASR1M107_17730 [Ignavibacteriales bacterium]
MWDKVNLTRKVTAIGGIDAHAHRINLLGFFEVEVFPYKVLYKSIRTYVILSERIFPTDDPILQKKYQGLILNALRDGRSFVANYYHGDATGFRFFGVVNGEVFEMGDTIPMVIKINLKVLVPTVCWLRLITTEKLLMRLQAAMWNLLYMKKGFTGLKCTTRGGDGYIQIIFV